MVCTPSFLKRAEEKNMGFFAIYLYGLQVKRPKTEPSMLVGNPTIIEAYFEDDGRTIQAPAPFKFFAIRSDEEPDEEAGETVGKSRVTFMLPEDY